MCVTSFAFVAAVECVGDVKAFGEQSLVVVVRLLGVIGEPAMIME